MNLLKVINWKIKDYKNRKLIDDLCEKLNEEFNELLGINHELYLVYEDFHKRDYYKVRQGYKQSSMDFRFDIYYDGNFNLSYIYIEWFEVNPKGGGRGRQVISSFLSIIRGIKTIDKIFLDPVIGPAERFWRMRGFRNTNMQDKKVNHSKVNCYGRLVYDNQ
jgi:hypothetical protein